ncbi:hypothetical protein [Brachybacterium sp. ACRRE]|uniref:hypothetical protein n=1 Tax=Brachybacterium sp. ACRRE TaxID=2918184 RepID=UPI001EF2CFB6|nr:hypothetical protein [Brachybacterium sp. ACRRE]MCG7309220.1 hypothetical protein [Brachybacterium sp. ACRRE]
METATDEPRRSRHRLQLFVLAALLIAGLLGMHALVGGSAAVTASTAASGHVSSASHGMVGAAIAPPAPTASGSHGMVHGSGGCADAMSGGGGSVCASVPTGKSVPALPGPPVVSLPELVPAAAPTPPSQTPRRFALTHLELSIHRT